MYRAFGTVEYTTNQVRTSYQTKSHDRIEILDIQEQKRDSSIQYKVICKFEVFLNEDSTCLMKSDYVGKVRPYLDTIIQSGLILNIQIHNLEYKNISLKHITDYLY
ncbi:hypothetical protein CSV60_06630 [Sporosarcina sp. P7]|nr:hypothetical protein CSV60_06630 [Sporosarcina sp. P7]